MLGMTRQFFSYIVVGVSNTALTTIVMFSLATMGCHYVLYTAIGYGFGFLNSFFFNGRWTFRGAHLKSALLGKFMVINLSLLGVVQLLQIALIEGLKLREFLAVITGMIVYTIAGFFLNRRLFNASAAKRDKI
jgi:putative flippase GtrA